MSDRQAHASGCPGLISPSNTMGHPIRVVVDGTETALSADGVSVARLHLRSNRLQWFHLSSRLLRWQRYEHVELLPTKDASSAQIKAGEEAGEEAGLWQAGGQPW